MLVRRCSAALRLICFLTLVALAVLAGPAARAGAGGAPVRVVTRGLTAEPLPPTAFEPTISAPSTAGLSAAPALAPSHSGPGTEILEADLAVDIPQMPGILTVQRTLPPPSGDDEEWELDVLYPDGQPRDFTIAVPKEVELERRRPKSFAITIDGRDVPLGEARTATILLTSDDDDDDDHDDDDRGHSYSDHDDDDRDRDRDKYRARVLRIPVRFVRGQGAVLVESSCAPGAIERDERTSCTVTLTNTGAADAEVALLAKLPRQLRLVRGSVTGGRGVGRDRVVFKGTLPGSRATGVSAAVDPDAAPVGYVPLRLLGIAPIDGVGDETLSNVTVPAFSFGGASHTRLGIASNGYVILGGGDADDISAANVPLPDARRPNGTLAPFWTDLDPGAGGAIRVATVSTGAARWLVVDYDRVANRSQPAAINSFQVWIGLDAPDTIGFVYGPTLTGGDGGRLTIGAESADGSTGATIHYNGSGETPGPSAPSGSFAVGLRVAPGRPATHTLSFTAWGHHRGAFVGYIFLRSSSFEGTAVTTFAGEVLHD